jgi:hypothetical protein
MQHTDLFMELAGIAGVFVGFGALIAVRRGGPTEPPEVAYTRGMVAIGVLVVVAALAPVTLGFFDLAEHQVWAVSSVLFLVVALIMAFTIVRTPEYRTNVGAQIEKTRAPSGSRWMAVGETVLSGASGVALVLIPVVILLGVAPDLEAGLYFALCAFALLQAAWMLLILVFAQRLPATASDQAELPASGGSSA